MLRGESEGEHAGQRKRTISSKTSPAEKESPSLIFQAAIPPSVMVGDLMQRKRRERVSLAGEGIGRDARKRGRRFEGRKERGTDMAGNRKAVKKDTSYERISKRTSVSLPERAYVREAAFLRADVWMPLSRWGNAHRFRFVAGHKGRVSSSSPPVVRQSKGSRRTTSTYEGRAEEGRPYRHCWREKE